ncbi:unnamed protein product [Toxocara canis]|uniref:WD_REPEATS_REGION domain-containing protein n=1 Tax=Toxocara canis TaxID=6265 RepID=A0A183U6M9_TOXCA|nr:unnamed protein product [Toxocara canis]
MAIVDNAAERILANCGEDGFIELWALSSEHHLSHKQFMRTPAQTAWSIAALNNGDIAVGAKLSSPSSAGRFVTEKAGYGQMILVTGSRHTMPAATCISRRLLDR